MNYREPKQCEACNKKIFSNEDQAREYLGSLLRRRRQIQKPGAWAVRPYECLLGNGWHVGRDHNTLLINFKKGRTKNVDKRGSSVQDKVRIPV